MLSLLVSSLPLVLGSIVIFLSVYFYLNYKNIVYLSYLFINASLFLYLGVLILLNLGPAAGIQLNRGLSAVLTAIMHAGRLVAVYFIVVLFHFLYNVRKMLVRNVLLAVVVSGAIVLFLKEPRYYFLSFAAFAVVTAYLLVLFGLHYRKLRTEAIYRLQLICMWLVLLYTLFVPGQYLAVFWGWLPAVWLKETLVMLILYTVWNLLFLRFILRFLQVKPIPLPQRAIAMPDALARYNLTEREREVVNCLVRGEKVGQIAKQLFISEHTAKTHVKNIYLKMKVSCLVLR